MRQKKRTELSVEERDDLVSQNALVHRIKSMRSRDVLSAIIHAAEARDCHLSNIEAAERAKRLWSKFNHIKEGDTVFAHTQPEGKYSWLWGKPLVVTKVQPRSKLITVRGDERGKGASLTPHMLHGYKISLEPTTAAFANSLSGDTIARKFKST